MSFSELDKTGLHGSSSSKFTDETDPKGDVVLSVDSLEFFQHDTLHYLTPATTARTEYEGDFDYQRFLLKRGSMQIPAFSDPTASPSFLSCEESEFQRTIAIIKPEAMVYKDVVLKAIIDGGFSIVNQRTLQFTPEQVAEIYAKHYGCPSFPNVVISMSIGPLLVLSLSGMDAVEKWKALIGPERAIHSEWFCALSVRNRFGMKEMIPDVLHASENLHESNKENRYVFPDSFLEPLPCEEDVVKDYCSLHVNPTLSNGLTELARVKPIDPVLFLGEWLLLHNPFQPTFPDKVALTAT